MRRRGIRTFYEVKYEPQSNAFWQHVGLPGHADATYVLHGFGAKNGFMPLATVSNRGPGGGGWILTNAQLQVCLRGSGDRPVQLWAGGRVFAAGDCHYGAVAGKAVRSQPRPGGRAVDAFEAFTVAPVPKTALGAVAWARLACRNVLALHNGWPLEVARWPCEAGIVAAGLGTNDGVVCWKVKCLRDSGEVVFCGEAAAEMKRRLTWPEDRAWLVDPTRWLSTFQEGLPAGLLLSEHGRSALKLASRAW